MGIIFLFSMKKVRSSRSFNNGTSTSGSVILTGSLADEEAST